MSLGNQQDTIIIHRHYTNHGELQTGLDALADAVVLMNAGASLDDALRIARDRANAVHQQQVRRRALDTQMAVLRAQLQALEEQARESAI